jgi:hypothetical protein|tara:strand:- start:125 stop:481 length:357 start_codon:yes stop_codon:yes gene_type:complete
MNWPPLQRLLVVVYDSDNRNCFRCRRLLSQILCGHNLEALFKWEEIILAGQSVQTSQQSSSILNFPEWGAKKGGAFTPNPTQLNPLDDPRYNDLMPNPVQGAFKMLKPSPLIRSVTMH